MSMGNSACFAEVIEPKKIRLILGNLEDGRKLTSFIRLFNKLEEDEGASCLIEFLTDGNDNAVSEPDGKDLVKLRGLAVNCTLKLPLYGVIMQAAPESSLDKLVLDSAAGKK